MLGYNALSGFEIIFLEIRAKRRIPSEGEKIVAQKPSASLPVTPASAKAIIGLVEELAEALGIKTGDELVRRFSSHAFNGLLALNGIDEMLKAGNPVRDGIAEYLNHCYWKYRRVSERKYALEMTDAEVKRHMAGSAMWDDPPTGWTEADLLTYSRGYLNAESTQLGNAAEYFRSALYHAGFLPSSKPKGSPVPFKPRKGRVVKTAPTGTEPAR